MWPHCCDCCFFTVGAAYQIVLLHFHAGHLLHLCDGVAHKLPPFFELGNHTRQLPSQVLLSDLLIGQMHLLFQDSSRPGSSCDPRGLACHYHYLSCPGNSADGKEECHCQVNVLPLNLLLKFICVGDCRARCFWWLARLKTVSLAEKTRLTLV